MPKAAGHDKHVLMWPGGKKQKKRAHQSGVRTVKGLVQNIQKKKKKSKCQFTGRNDRIKVPSGRGEGGGPI